MRVIGSVLALTVFGLGCLGAPPRVVEATPDNGDIGVDPGLTEITIRFDQAMNTGGMSIVGGGDRFPEITGKARWVDDRTIIIPIRLRSDHEYRLSINNERYRNFRSARGEPAVPYPIRFLTGGDDVHAGAIDFGDSVDRLVELLETSYSHRDRLGLDWAEVIGEHREALETAATIEDFASALGTVLARAEDKHIKLEANGQRFGTYVRPVVANVNQGAVERRVVGYQRHNSAVASGRIEEWSESGDAVDIGYVAIDTWSASVAEEVRAALDVLEDLRDATALIVDVRFNGGGDELLAREIAGCFIEETVAYAKHVSIDADSPGAFTGVSTRYLRANKDRPRFPGRVAVLTGPVCMSSNEAFILMMRSAGATVVGDRTQGSSGNPRGYDLGNDLTIYLPSWRAMTMDGVFIEGVGIAPDVLVQGGGAGDPVLAAAVRELMGE